MQIVIDIPEKEFGIEIEDKFHDFFKRLEVETKEHMISGTNLLCGAYELETIQMLMQALAKGTPLPNTLEYLETAYTGARACNDVAEQVRLARAIAAYKQDVHEEWMQEDECSVNEFVNGFWNIIDSAVEKLEEDEKNDN